MTGVRESIWWRLLAVTAAVAVTLGGYVALRQEASAADKDFEVWLIDQSDSPGRTYGGLVYIYPGKPLTTGANPSATPPSQVIDLSAATAQLCMTRTGANPVRPHMITFNSTQTHAVVSFVASGHVVVFNAATRTPVACMRTEVGAGGARQAHAIWPSRDDRYLFVANQNGKKMERIRTDYPAGTFTQEPAATVDLAGCTTPHGLPCQSPALRPDNAPICPFIASDNGPLFVSLRGGGLLVLDWRTTPMSIVAEYDTTAVPANGCGFTEAKGRIFADGGGGTAANLDQYSVFRLPMTGYAASNPVNTPAVQLLFNDDSPNRDAHGSEATAGADYVWVGDRDANVVEVFDASSGARTGTINLVSPYSADPTPDLFATAPDHKHFFLSTRGPTPLSGDPHSSHGENPGMLIVRVTGNGKSANIIGLVPIRNPDPISGVERADAHGIRVRTL